MTDDPTIPREDPALGLIDRTVDEIVMAMGLNISVSNGQLGRWRDALSQAVEAQRAAVAERDALIARLTTEIEALKHQALEESMQAFSLVLETQQRARDAEEALAALRATK